MFAESCGRYFKWLAHDDRLRPEYLAATVAVLEADPSVVLCNTTVDYIDGRGVLIGQYRSPLGLAAAERPSERFAALVLHSHSCVDFFGTIRRSALEGSLLHGPFHGADRALLAQLALRGRMVQLEQALVEMREHPDRYTRRQRSGSASVARGHGDPSADPLPRALSNLSPPRRDRAADRRRAAGLPPRRRPLVALELERAAGRGRSRGQRGAGLRRVGRAGQDPFLRRRPGSFPRRCRGPSEAAGARFGPLLTEPARTAPGRIEDRGPIPPPAATSSVASRRRTDSRCSTSSSFAARTAFPEFGRGAALGAELA